MAQHLPAGALQTELTRQARSRAFGPLSAQEEAFNLFNLGTFAPGDVQKPGPGPRLPEGPPVVISPFPQAPGNIASQARQPGPIPYRGGLGNVSNILPGEPWRPPLGPPSPFVRAKPPTPAIRIDGGSGGGGGSIGAQPSSRGDLGFGGDSAFQSPSQREAAAIAADSRAEQERARAFGLSEQIQRSAEDDRARRFDLIRQLSGQLIDDPELGVLTSTPVERSQTLRDVLAREAAPVTLESLRGDPRIAAFRLAQQRAGERGRAEAAAQFGAERGGTPLESGAFRGELAKQREARGEAEGRFEAGLFGEEIGARRAALPGLLGQEQGELGRAATLGEAALERRSRERAARLLTRNALRTQLITQL